MSQLAFTLLKLAQETSSGKEKQALYHQSAGYYKELTGKAPNSIIYNNLALCKLDLARLEQKTSRKQKFLEEARDICQESVNQNDKSSIAWNSLSNCLLKLAELEQTPESKWGFLEEALAKCQKAVDLDDTHYVAMCTWGECLQALATLEQGMQWGMRWGMPGMCSWLFLCNADLLYVSIGYTIAESDLFRHIDVFFLIDKLITECIIFFIDVFYRLQNAL